MTGSTDAQLAVAIAEIERLRARIAELEAALHLRGTPIAQNYPPSEPPQAGSLTHVAKIGGDRESIWQAYLAGERDYGALAMRFGRTRATVSAAIRDIRNSRAFGPITAKDHEYRCLLQAAMRAFRIMRTTDG